MPDEVFGHLVDFRRWRAWSPFEQFDPGPAFEQGLARLGEVVRTSR